MKIVT